MPLRPHAATEEPSTPASLLHLYEVTDRSDFLHLMERRSRFMQECYNKGIDKVARLIQGGYQIVHVDSQIVIWDKPTVVLETTTEGIETDARDCVEAIYAGSTSRVGGS